VLVTGGTGGIGRAIVRAFAAEGAQVAFTYRTSADAANTLAASLGSGARTLVVRYDLAEAASIASAIGEIESAWGGIDVLVTAAVQWSTLGPFLDQPFDSARDEAWLPLLRVNLEGHIRTAQHVLPGMRARRWGRIALLSSYHATEGTRGSEFYGAAKAGVARVVTFVCSEANGNLTGEIIPVTGGY
jgi:3-oxoacyl-[acyl-carrier protein] reductase